MRTIKCAELMLGGSAPSLKNVLDWAWQWHKADRMFVTLYTDRVRGKWKVRYPNAETATAALFAPFILRVFLARSWPPSDYLRHPHIVCVMRYSPEVGDIMLKRESDITGWLNSDGLPEDICLFNSRGNLPAFCSAIHDNQAWLIDPTGIEGDFFDSWEAGAAAIRRQLQIQGGYAFCRAWSSQRHVSMGALRRFLKGC
jgi:hypothetical protein